MGSYKSIISEALASISKMQLPSGQFPGKLSSNSNDFKNATLQPTPFYTSLIVGCISNIKEAENITRKAARFLEGERTETWSWNYWDQKARQRRLQNYPDDLDDTACAIAAIRLSRPEMIDGGSLGAFAKLLISCEVKPGGPYNTWIVDTEQHPEWYDIDIAVNANIGYCLSLNEVSLEGLNKFIVKSIRDSKLQSSYYIGIIPTLYFISRWHTGASDEELNTLISKELVSVKNIDNPVMLAMLVSSACYIKLPRSAVRAAIQKLLSYRIDSAWGAYALYGEPAKNGIPQFGGSEALTTALSIEALTLCEIKTQPTSPKEHSYNLTDKAIERVHQDINKVNSKILKQELQQNFNRMLKINGDGQISRTAQFAAMSYKVTADKNVVELLDCASLYGWLAYTIYDDFLDDEGNALSLSTAHFASRRMVSLFNEAIPDKVFSRHVENVLTKIDAANSWEAKYARAQKKNGCINIKSLPLYGNYAYLAERSWGHTLASYGVLYAHDDKDKQELALLEKFFHHFLIARQLNDDAHDWEDDLSNGHVSSVLALLLKNEPLSIKIEPKKLDELRLKFWQHTILDVSDLIFNHIALARDALSRSKLLINKKIYLGWLSRLDQATKLAVNKRSDAEKFINKFQS